MLNIIKVDVLEISYLWYMISNVSYISMFSYIYKLLPDETQYNKLCSAYILFNFSSDGISFFSDFSQTYPVAQCKIDVN